MSSVLGIDLSTRAIDLVKLDESTNAATWTRVELEGKTALERLRNITKDSIHRHTGFWDDVYLVGIEAPMSRQQPGTLAKLSRVFGAVVACLPPLLEVWEVSPVAWRKELGLPGNASKEECADAVRNIHMSITSYNWPQDALDAYAVAYYARQVNARGIAA
jgi:Holliday junction resolvasome RuvABC endonuclease subunit